MNDIIHCFFKLILLYLTTHSPLPKPGQISVIQGIFGPRVDSRQIHVEVEPTEIVLQQISR